MTDFEASAIKIINQDQPAKLAQEFHIAHTPNEFLISMIEVIPNMEFKMVQNQSGSGHLPKLHSAGFVQKVSGRYVLSPAAMKKFSQVLVKNIQQYEKKFGEIALHPPPEGMQ